ncbi:TetR/AcrR family transcriptional regulator [Aeromicrobium sp.]|uniref:TetR/AcrR family transcriptional regulator n=1 Tax=Aeromicrobium sp. TaxID=1871063 RepID=UPI004033222D
MSTTSASSPDPVSRRRAATRERLLDAARTLLVREGLQGVSVERLCEEAGYTRGAFYSNFESKDDLVVALVMREKEAILKTLREAAEPSTLAGLQPEEAAGAILERFLLLQPPDLDMFLLHLELQTRGLRGDVGGDVFVGWWHEVIDGISDVLTVALDAVGLRLTLDVKDVSVILMGMWDAMVLSSLVDDRPVDIDTLRTTLPRMLLALTEPV